MRWRRVHGAMLGLPGELHAGLVNWKEGTHRHWLEGRGGSEGHELWCRARLTLYSRGRAVVEVGDE